MGDGRRRGGDEGEEDGVDGGVEGERGWGGGRRCRY